MLMIKSSNCNPNVWWNASMDLLNLNYMNVSNDLQWGTYRSLNLLIGVWIEITTKSTRMNQQKYIKED